MFRDKCLVCGNKHIQRILNFGMHPFADTFITKEKLSQSELVYPLLVDLCEECGQIQLNCETNAMDRYVLSDYSYTSSNSDFSRNHWKKYAKDIIKKFNLQEWVSILEIGSNDAFLLKQFKDCGIGSKEGELIGVDPSGVMASIAKYKYDIDTIVDLFPFTVENNKKLIPSESQDIIIANNVFNHANDPLLFVKEVADLLNDNGYFIFELPYWMDSVNGNKFDQIYHEHISYFTVKSSESLLRRVGLKIIGVEHVDYHGGAIKIFATKNGNIKINDDKDKFIEEEEKCGLFENKTYKEWMRRLYFERNEFLKTVCEIKFRGEKIIAIGAAAKGNTFLNFNRLDGTILDYVTDSSEYKQGKYTPLTRIPIVGDEIFAKYDHVYALFLSWNISSQIKKILSKINPNIQYIAPGVK